MCGPVVVLLQGSVSVIGVAGQPARGADGGAGHRAGRHRGAAWPWSPPRSPRRWPGRRCCPTPGHRLGGPLLRRRADGVAALAGRSTGGVPAGGAEHGAAVLRAVAGRLPAAPPGRGRRRSRRSRSPRPGRPGRSRGRRRAGASSPATSARATGWRSPPRPGHAVVVDAGPDPAPIDACLRRLRVQRGGRPGADPLPRRPRRRRARGAARPGRPRRSSPARCPSPTTSCVRSPAGPARPAVPVQPLYAGDTLVVGPGHRAGPVARQGDPRGLGAQQRQRRPRRRRSGPADPAARRRRARGGPPGAARPGAATRRTQRDPRFDVLKVAHHGSRLQDPQLVAAAHATVALISVGRATPTATRPARRWRCCAASAPRPSAPTSAGTSPSSATAPARCGS